MREVVVLWRVGFLSWNAFAFLPGGFPAHIRSHSAGFGLGTSVGNYNPRPTCDVGMESGGLAYLSCLKSIVLKSSHTQSVICLQQRWSCLRLLPFYLSFVLKTYSYATAQAGFIWAILLPEPHRTRVIGVHCCVRLASFKVHVFLKSVHPEFLARRSMLFIFLFFIFCQSYF